MTHLPTKYCLTALTALLLASCAGDDVAEVITPDNNRTPIVFTNSYSDEMQSRASATTGLETRCSSFYVWGYKNVANPTNPGKDLNMIVMDGYKVKWRSNSAGTTDTNTHDWDYLDPENNQSVKYWDFSANSYQFMAIASENPDFNPTFIDAYCHHCRTEHTFNGIKFELTDCTHFEDLPYISDLWYSDNAVPNPSYGDVVNLRFTRPLCRVRVVLKLPEGVAPGSYKIENINFAPSDGETTIPIGAKSGIGFEMHFPKNGTNPIDPTPHIGWPTSVNLYNTISSITIPYEETTTDYASEAQKWYYVFPTQDISEFFDDSPLFAPFLIQSYTMRATVNGHQSEASVPATYMQWRQNHEYTYVFRLSPTEGIRLEYHIDDIIRWKAGASKRDEW